MPRFIQILQIVLAVVIGSFVGYDLILHGISIFDEKYVAITCVLWLILEIALFVIYKLIEDDQTGQKVVKIFKPLKLSGAFSFLEKGFAVNTLFIFD